MMADRTMIDDEIQQRTCRACGKDYAYPVRGHLATRFYCDDCVALEPEVRDAFETYNKRIKSLEKRLARLEKAAGEASGASRGEG